MSDGNRILIAEKRDGVAFVVHDKERWTRIEEIAG